MLSERLKPRACRLETLSEKVVGLCVHRHLGAAHNTFFVVSDTFPGLFFMNINDRLIRRLIIDHCME